MDASALPPGTVVDRYTVEDVIGFGGMAIVWRVRHNDLGSTHALKVLQTRSPAVRDRLVQEGRLQAALRHPNLVAVTDLVVLEDGDPGLIMELVQGPSLRELLDESPLSLDQSDALASGILAGVAEAHRSGLVHRDLKPANILLEPSSGNYLPKVADFGIAKILADDGGNNAFRTRTGIGLGTPHYMAPEQIEEAKSVGPAADVFALGVILYEMVTHVRPFDGPTQLAVLNAVTIGEFEPAISVCPDLPPGVDEAIRAALQKAPADRPASVEELAERWFAGRAILPPSSRPFPSVKRETTLERTGEEWRPRPSRPITGGPPTPTSPSTELPTSWRPLAAVAAVGLALAGAALLAVGLGTLWWFWPSAPPPPGRTPTPAVVVQPEAPLGSPATVDVAETTDEETDGEEPTAEDTGAAEVEPVAPATSAGPPPAPTPSSAAPEPASALDSPNPRVRIAALERLADRGAWQQLDRVARQDPSPGVRAAAWRTVLQVWNDRKGVGPLEDTLSWKLKNGGRDDAVDAADALGDYGREPRSLVPGLHRNLAKVRASTLDAVLKIHRRSPGFGWRRHVRPLLDADAEEVRKKAERVLRKL